MLGNWFMTHFKNNEGDVERRLRRRIKTARTRQNEHRTRLNIAEAHVFRAAG
jgi:hypothetical protein